MIYTRRYRQNTTPSTAYIPSCLSRRYQYQPSTSSPTSLHSILNTHPRPQQEHRGIAHTRTRLAADLPRYTGDGWSTHPSAIGLWVVRFGRCTYQYAPCTSSSSLPSRLGRHQRHSPNEGSTRSRPTSLI